MKLFNKQNDYDYWYEKWWLAYIIHVMNGIKERQFEDFIFNQLNMCVKEK